MFNDFTVRGFLIVKESEILFACSGARAGAVALSMYSKHSVGEGGWKCCKALFVDTQSVSR